MKKEQVAIIIPIYNLWKQMTLPCLESLSQHTALNQVSIYVIDNGSTDVDSDQILSVGKSLFGDKFTYHRFDKNQGFSIACNMGAKLASQNGDEFIFLLNNDTIVTENWLSPLLLALEDSKIGAVGSLLLYPQTQRVQHCGVSMTPFGGLVHIYANFPAKHPLVLKKRYLLYITGAAFLIRTKLFMEIGMLSEEYLNGLEDIDLCYKLTSKGYLVQVVPESVIYHYESQSAGRRDTADKNFEVFRANHKEFVYDYSHIAKKDGYILSLTKESQYYLAFPQEKADQYTKALSAHFSPQACEKLLEKEPLWIEGYEMLAKYYDEQNMGGKASYMREFAVAFCPTIENYNRVISSFIRYGEKERAAIFQRQLGRINEKMKDTKNQAEMKNLV